MTRAIRRSRRAITLTVVVCSSVVVTVDAPAAADDVDGDGNDEIAIGLPHAVVDAYLDEGTVLVLPGSPAGADVSAIGEFNRATSDIAGDVTPGELFGSGLAWGDVDGDGHDDLVVGSIWRGITTLPGGPDGINPDGMAPITRDTEGLAGELLGASTLQTGDFDGDGYDDVAVGNPGPDFGTGAVLVLPGSPGGLTAEGSTYLTADSAGIPGRAESGDLWGSSLAAGDFDGDSYVDLAVGHPGEEVGDLPAAGAVTVLHGSSSGLGGGGSSLWHSDVDGVAGIAEPRDLLGISLAAGDFDGDGRDDLAAGALENLKRHTDAGAVLVLRGSVTGIVAAESRYWHQGVPGVAGTPEAPDWFGVGLTAADVDADGFDELVVGAPQESVGSVQLSGALHVLPGSAAGLTTVGSALVHQGTSGVGKAEFADLFARRLTSADVDGDGKVDVVAGVPGEDIGSVRNAGAVFVLRGSDDGLTGVGTAVIHANTPGVPTDAAEDALLGGVLASPAID